MISRLPTQSPLNTREADFLTALRASGFEGEIDRTQASRTVLSTDNSIYQRYPKAVLFPRHAADVRKVAALMARDAYRHVVVTPRGGGTGTNGQSLTDGIVLDLSRHMNRILDIDVVNRRARVEAGVVKDQLNAALKVHGLFFAPELSTSNRATIGGMINTDASGQGSCTYGKTRDHVLSTDTVLLGGEQLHTVPVTEDELTSLCARDDIVGRVYRTAHQISTDQAELIRERFPKLNRCLTGYDLAHLRNDTGHFDLNSVLCGSEGTLGIIVEATLNVLPIPKYAVLVNIRYAGFMDALRDARALLAHHPLSIETIDSKVLLLAMKDIVWQSVAEYFPANPQQETLGINLVEFSGDDEAEVHQRVAAFVAHIEQDGSVQRLGHTLASGATAVTQVYAMRKRAVGLLGNVEGEVRPQPFVEDTAVPPEKLADFIAEFRSLLDGYRLSYGMFGHVDAGVLHVRPALNMRDPVHAAMIRPISDAVTRLTQKYGGLLWGEHGKGVRSEYVPQYFGELYPSLQTLKAAFDPNNQLNPGKIATAVVNDEATGPRVIPLLKIDAVPLRADGDRQIDERVWQSYGTAVHCNGNGACYNFDPDDAMCPSWKATRQRIHSPKGRAALMREWLRLQGANGVDVLSISAAAPSFLKSLPQRVRHSWFKQRGESDFSHEVYDAMAGCLACKSCAGQCPVKVNVPDFRARFLALYHTRYLRPLRDYLIGSLEYSLPYLSKVPGVYNALLQVPLMQKVMQRYGGLVDSPTLSRFDWRFSLQKWGVREADAAHLATLSDAARSKSVIIVPDAFTRYFETPLLAAFVELASRLGYTVFMAPFMPNGKPLQVQGFLSAFEKTATKTAARLNDLSRFGIPLVGLDPAMTLVYRQEYLKLPNAEPSPKVALPQEWLADVISPRPAAQSSVQSAAQSAAQSPARAGGQATRYRLLAHCTERTNAPSSTALWRKVFERAGLTLTTPASGCCGMSGTYGHESRNVATSKTIFEQSWAAHVDDAGEAGGELLATGYSCRSQAARMRQTELRHPIEALLDVYR